MRVHLFRSNPLLGAWPSRFNSRIAIRALAFILPAVLAVPARAQGGPPFITDDPAPPGNHHWEINFEWTANHNPGQSFYQIPDVDMNYGWGDRIQLKWEQPLAAGTNANNSTGVGLGESLLGIKFRAYQHYTPGKEKTDDNINFSIGTYPQVSLNTPAGSAQRGIVDPGPQYYLPMEVTTQLGWLALDGEIGRWIGNANAPNQWGRGLIAGHSFSDRFEAYTEIYDLQAINRIGDQPKQRSLTLDLGGRQSLYRANHVRLLFMGGRGIQAVTRTNGEPSWIAYVGVQFLLGPKE
jgi:hypothetical protein